MDRGRNLEALAEEDDEEEMEEHQEKDSDSDASSTSDDELPDEGTKRGEPNKFDIHCDGVSNAMALVHTALEELLEMKDLMLKHNLPPPLLIKLTTNTGKVFRSVNDLDSSVNELVRLVRVYSTPWEEKSAALKKLHEDYEIKQRQLNIAIKRLQLVDTHSKRIAREKRVMNWEKLFAKMMSNKGHGRRWKFLIETIKQKAKLGLEHVQEYTKALEESSDEEEDEMPSIQLKGHTRGSPVSTSDKISEDESQKEEEEEEGEEETGEVQVEVTKEEEAESEESETEEKVIPSIKIELEDDETEQEEEDLMESRSSESAKRVRFAAEVKAPPKVETSDASIWTEEPDYDKYLFVRMYTPVSMKQEDLKCSVTFGKQFYKTKKLESKRKPQGDEDSEPSISEIKRGSYEEAMFEMPDTVPDGVWQETKSKDTPPKNCQISVHSGQMEMIVAMATIDLADLQELDLKEVFLPPPHGDDDVPKTPEPPDDDDDLHSLSSDVDILLPDEDTKKSKEEEAPKEDYVKDVDPMMFPLYSLDGSTSTHKPCGKLPLIFYWGKKARPVTYNRQVGTHGVTDLVFEMTGIDLETTTKEDLQKNTTDSAVSPIDFAPRLEDRALSVIRFTPEAEPPSPTPSPEMEIPEHISPDIKEEEPKEEMVPKFEYDKLMEKHSRDILIVQEEYEKRLQSLLNNMHTMEQTQALHQQQIMHQQQQIQQQQQQLTAAKKQQEKRKTSGVQSPVPITAPPVTPAKQGPTSEDVSQPIVHQPMPPQKKRRAPVRPHMPQPPQYKSWEGIPDDFLERLDYFEYLSYRHKQELLDKTKQDIQEDIEKKLAGQHKLSKKDEEMYEALNDVSLPALFMPFTRGTVFNPRAHQYFHPTGSNNLRLTQPPSVFQLPPLQRSKSSILNLFELSKNFNTRGQGWLMDRYIQQQEPVKNAHGMAPQMSAPTSRVRSPPFTPQHTLDLPGQGESRQRTLEQEAEC